MTKLRIISDVHLEFGSFDLDPIGEDIRVLAGDIGLAADGAHWAAHHVRRYGIPTVMIAGNHEFYNQYGAPKRTVRETLEHIRAVADLEPLLTFLDDDIATVAGITFVGTTLWTDYSLYGEATRSTAMLAARHAMNDHRLILDDHGLFTPECALARHKWSVDLLRERLPRRYIDGPLVVVTHHLPSGRSINRRFFNNYLNAAYASNLDDLVELSGAAIWVHGHTHTSTDYMIGDTRVICNPRGYYPNDLNEAFDPNLIVEI